MATAHGRVQTALRSGALTRQPCEVCGVEEVFAHHDDYSRPLDVRWLCQQHHIDWHRGGRLGANRDVKGNPKGVQRVAGTTYAHAVGRLETIAALGSHLGKHMDSFREARDEAIRDALDEGVSVSRIAKALGISRQATDDVVKRVRRG